MVRYFESVAAPATTGTLTLPRQAFDRPDQGEVVLFVQDSQTWEVLGAVRMALE